MATFVLVHGSWAGGWYWKKLTPLLRAAGHDVFTPTLTGLGERAHLLTPDVGLDTHIRDITNVLRYEDLRDVLLVGHAYGGMVISGVADVCTDRLVHLIYLDARIPTDGQAYKDLFTQEEWAARSQEAATAGEGWRVPPPMLESLVPAYGAEDAQWMVERLTPHPIKAFEQPVRLTNQAADAIPRTYIRCTGMRATGQPLAARPGWRYRELAAPHSGMVAAPKELAELLFEVATVANTSD
jgi:pimeloyl-ACP methyl ester carboxylesterase